MPRWDFVCDDCGHTQEGVSHKCDVEAARPSHCGKPMTTLWNEFKPAVFTFEPFETCNILPDGSKIRIHSKSQLSRLCNEYGLAHTPEPDKVMRDGKLVPKEKTGVVYSR